MTSVDVALEQLANQWDALNWDFRPLDVDAGVEKVSQWQGTEHDDVMVVCQKIYAQPLDPEAIPAFAMKKFYGSMLPHVHYIGQITSVLR